MVERRRSAASGSNGASLQGGADAEGGSGEVGDLLPATEAAVWALPATGSQWVKAQQCGKALEPGQAGGTATESAGGGAKALWRSRGRAIRADAGGRASQGRARHRRRCRDTAAVDVAGGSVEPGAEEEAVPIQKVAEGAFRRTVADGRELSPMAGRSSRTRLFDQPGGRCDGDGGSAFGRRRDHLGGGRCVAEMGGELRDSASDLHRLEECVPRDARTGWQEAPVEPVRTDVRAAGN